MKVYYDKDADLSPDQGQEGHHRRLRLAGPRARAEPATTRGVKVTVGLRKGGASWDKVEKAGLKVAEVADAVKARRRRHDAAARRAASPHVYKNDVEPNIKQGASLAFAHGFNVHYGQVVPRADLDVVDGRAEGARATPCARPTRRAAACRT